MPSSRMRDLYNASVSSTLAYWTQRGQTFETRLIVLGRLIPSPYYRCKSDSPTNQTDRTAISTLEQV